MSYKPLLPVFRLSALSLAISAASNLALANDPDTLEKAKIIAETLDKYDFVEQKGNVAPYGKYMLVDYRTYLGGDGNTNSGKTAGFTAANYALTKAATMKGIVGSTGANAAFFAVDWAGYVIGESLSRAGHNKAAQYLPSGSYSVNIEYGKGDFLNGTEIALEVISNASLNMTASYYNTYGGDIIVGMGSGDFSFMLDLTAGSDTEIAGHFQQALGGGGKRPEEEKSYWDLWDPDELRGSTDDYEWVMGGLAGHWDYSKFYFAKDPGVSEIKLDCNPTGKYVYLDFKFVRSGCGKDEIFNATRVKSSDNDDYVWNDALDYYSDNELVSGRSVDPLDYVDGLDSLGIRMAVNNQFRPGGAVVESRYDITLSEWENIVYNLTNSIAELGSGNDRAENVMRVHGNEGDDLIISAVTTFGNDGNDTILDSRIARGGDGNDTIVGSDLLAKGGDGDDYIANGIPNLVKRRIAEEAGYTVTARMFTYGEDGNDVIIAREGYDYIHGGKGDDTITEHLTTEVPRNFYVDDTEEYINYIDGGSGTDSLRLIIKPTNGTAIFSVNDPKLDEGIFDIHSGYSPSGQIDARIQNVEQIVIDTEAESTTFSALLHLPMPLQYNGNSGVDSVSGTDYSDLIRTGAGDDRLFGFSGDDLLDGGKGHDLIHGHLGKDIIFPGTGSDTIYGGGNVDLLNYSTVPTGVQVNLASNVATRSESEDIDAIYDIENVIGTDYDDEIVGTTSKNTLFGGEGNNKLSGLGGGDTLIASWGDDELDGGFGNDILFGGMGHDTFTGGPGADEFHIVTVSSATQSNTITDFDASEGDKLILDARALGIYQNSGHIRHGYSYNSNEKDNPLIFNATDRRLEFNAADGNNTVLVQFGDDVTSFDMSAIEYANLDIRKTKDLGDLKLKFGEIFTHKFIEEVTHEQSRYRYPERLPEAVVITSAATTNGTAPGVVQLMEVRKTGVDVRFAEWSNENGYHDHAESVDLLGANKGRYNMIDGSVWEFDREDLTAHNEFIEVNFAEAFDNIPKVFASAIANNQNPQAVTVQIIDVTRTGFKAALVGTDEEREAGPITLSKTQSFNFVAIDAPSPAGTIYVDDNAVGYQLYQTKLKSTDKKIGAHTYWLQEDRSLDDDGYHTRETVNVLNIGDASFIQQVTVNGGDTAVPRRR